MKCLMLCVLLFVSTLAEPPVDNRYLPPVSFSTQVYEAPSFGGGGQAGVGFRSRLSSTYGTPSIKSQSPSNQYVPPRSGQYQAPISQYQAPSSLYQSPSSSYQAPINQYQAPSSQYGLPNQGIGSVGNSYIAPSQEYGLPGLGRGSNQGLIGANGFSQSRQYLPPGRDYDDGSNGEPANYNFEYMVLDQYSGNDFGHRESRQGDRAEGVYYVLLPDGRKQTVEYEADNEGYKPRISYEDTGVRNGYDRNGQSYTDQYENGPY